MTLKKFNFDLGSRNLFPEELAVVGAVQNAVAASAARHGWKINLDAALFKEAPAVTPAAVQVAGGALPAVAQVHAGSDIALADEHLAVAQNHAGSDVPPGGGLAGTPAAANRIQPASAITDANKPQAGVPNKRGAQRTY
ncbi:hypothetical protein RBA41_13500 [Massilia sp. CCM 9210]|uniref:hypothetical protein n=1 Tax=Massilia scottii TaxID=3057166 RepID=UPI0027969F15|nr:hypothetical protein [Massilia sp. CCM 9210]MDQ1814325.1 hypothetical protein [Massilia sp. CCM 9210]